MVDRSRKNMFSVPRPQVPGQEVPPAAKPAIERPWDVRLIESVPLSELVQEAEAFAQTNVQAFEFRIEDPSNRRLVEQQFKYILALLAVVSARMDRLSLQDSSLEVGMMSESELKPGDNRKQHLLPQGANSARISIRRKAYPGVFNGSWGREDTLLLFEEFLHECEHFRQMIRDPRLFQTATIASQNLEVGHETYKRNEAEEFSRLVGIEKLRALRQKLSREIHTVQGDMKIALDRLLEILDDSSPLRSETVISQTSSIGRR